MQVTHSLSLYSEAMSQQRIVGVLMLVLSLAIGSFIGLQLSEYLAIMCAVRGTCYGEESGFVYYASLVHPLLIKLSFSAVFLMLLSRALKRFTPFQALESIGLIADKAKIQIQLLANMVLLFGATSLVFLLPLMYISTRV